MISIPHKSNRDYSTGNVFCFGKNAFSTLRSLLSNSKDLCGNKRSYAFFGVQFRLGLHTFLFWKRGMNVDEYKESYLLLWHAVDDALKAMDDRNYGQAEELLKKGQQDAEEAYIGQE